MQREREVALQAFRDVNGAALNSGVGPWSTNNVENVGDTTQQAIGTPA